MLCLYISNDKNSSNISTRQLHVIRENLSDKNNYSKVHIDCIPQSAVAFPCPTVCFINKDVLQATKVRLECNIVQLHYRKSMCTSIDIYIFSGLS